jgi:probable phosphoglycerate mutase
LILFRHGETQHNRGKITLGRADVPLNTRGNLQARAIAASILRPPAAIYSSPLSRCRDTANRVALATGCDVIVEPDLIEMDVGEMEHLTGNELRERYPDFLNAWLSAGGIADPDARMPGGETLSEVQARAWSAIERICASHPEGDIVVVTHNFVILTLACRALNIPLGDFRRLRTTVASKAVIDFAGPATTLLVWNDTSHLRSSGLA